MEYSAKGRERTGSFIASLALSGLIAVGAATFISNKYLPDDFSGRKPIQGEIIRDASTSGDRRYCLFYNGLSFELREGYVRDGEGIDSVLLNHGQTPTTDSKRAFMLIYQNLRKLPRQRDEGKSFDLVADPYKSSIRAGKVWIPKLSRKC